MLFDGLLIDGPEEVTDMQRSVIRLECIYELAQGQGRDGD